MVSSSGKQICLQEYQQLVNSQDSIAVSLSSNRWHILDIISLTTLMLVQGALSSQETRGGDFNWHQKGQFCQDRM